ncbi:hypothetical protein IAU59_003033 [Kwoniella sp. CBS 9459]
MTTAYPLGPYLCPIPTQSRSSPSPNNPTTHVARGRAYTEPFHTFPRAVPTASSTSTLDQSVPPELPCTTAYQGDTTPPIPDHWFYASLRTISNAPQGQYQEAFQVPQSTPTYKLADTQYFLPSYPSSTIQTQPHTDCVTSLNSPCSEDTVVAGMQGPARSGSSVSSLPELSALSQGPPTLYPLGNSNDDPATTQPSCVQSATMTAPIFSTTKTWSETEHAEAGHEAATFENLGDSHDGSSAERYAAPSSLDFRSLSSRDHVNRGAIGSSSTQDGTLVPSLNNVHISGISAEHRQCAQLSDPQTATSPFGLTPSTTSRLPSQSDRSNLTTGQVLKPTWGFPPASPTGGKWDPSQQSSIPVHNDYSIQQFPTSLPNPSHLAIPYEPLMSLPPPSISAYPTMMTHTPTFAVRPTLEFLISKPPKSKKILPSTPPKITGWIPPDQRPIPVPRQMIRPGTAFRKDDERTPRMIPITPRSPLEQVVSPSTSNGRGKDPCQLDSNFTTGTVVSDLTPTLRQASQDSLSTMRMGTPMARSTTHTLPPGSAITTFDSGSFSSVFAFPTPFGYTPETTQYPPDQIYGDPFHRSYACGDTSAVASAYTVPSPTPRAHDDVYMTDPAVVASVSRRRVDGHPIHVPSQHLPPNHPQARVVPPLLTHKPISVPDRPRRQSESRPSSVRSRIKIVNTLSNGKRPSTSDPKASSKKAKIDVRPSTGSSLTKFRCSECAELFTRRNDLERHVRCKHTAEKPFSCPACGKAFGRKDKLDQHIEKDRFCKQIAPPREERVRRRTNRLEIPPYRGYSPKLLSPGAQQQKQQASDTASSPPLSSLPLGYGLGDTSTFGYGTAVAGLSD